MARTQTHTSPASLESTSPRPHLPISPLRLQAYLLARETLRRLKPSTGPCFAREPGFHRRPPASDT